MGLGIFTIYLYVCLFEKVQMIESMDGVKFNGRNLTEGLFEVLERIVSFLLEKEAAGDFVYSSSVTGWVQQRSVISPLQLDHCDKLNYYSVGIAYLSSLNNGILEFSEGVNLWKWANAAVDVMRLVGWTPEQISNIIHSFPSPENDVKHRLGLLAANYASMDFEKGCRLLELLTDYRVSIKVGLMQSDYERYRKVFSTDDDPEFPLAALTYYLQTLGDISKEERVVREREILKLLQGNTDGFVVVVSNWVMRLKSRDSFVEECVLALISGLKDDVKSSLDTIDKAVSFHAITSDFMMKMAECIVRNHDVMYVLRMDYCLRELSTDKEVFEEFVLFFVIHTKGVYRRLGRALWDRYYAEMSDFDVNQLSEDFQMLFVYFMLQDFGNPETRLPKITPLLMSDSQKVRHAVRNRLLPYIDDYMGHVINEMDKQKIEGEEAELLRGYFEKRSEMVQRRRDLKELAPEYTCYNVYKEARGVEKDYMKLSLRDSEKEHKPIWMDMMKTVVLARGGGWRREDGTTSPLVPISYSVPSRMMVQSMTPKERIELFKDVFKDWDNENRDS